MKRGAPAGSKPSSKRKPVIAKAPALVDLASVEPASLSAEPVESYQPNRFFPPELHLNGRAMVFKVRAWLDLKWGVDTRIFDKSGAGDQDVPAVLSPETGRMSITLDDDTSRHLELLERRARVLLETGQEEPTKWQEVVKRMPPEKGGVHAVVKLYFAPRSGMNPIAATQFKVKQHDGTYITGTGWSFLQKHLLAFDSFRNSRCKVAFEPRYWVMSGNSSLTLSAAAVVFAPSEESFATTELGIDQIFPDAELL